MNDTDESIKSLISNSNDILKNNVIKAINPIRIGKDKGNPINNNPVLAVSKHYVYVEYSGNIFYWGEYENNARNGYGICKVAKVDSNKNKFYYEYWGQG